jgi:hypothetical protein
MSMEHYLNYTDYGEAKYLNPIATSSSTNPTWTSLGSNPGRLDEMPATNRPSRVRVGQDVYNVVVGYRVQVRQVFCFLRRAPQQMLRTHRSLEAYRAAL